MEKSEVQDLALEAILPHYRSSACISMGVGKTKLGLMFMAKNYTDYCKFLVVAPKKSIFQSWKDDAIKFGYEYLLPHIRFTTYLSLAKQSTDWELVVLDEMHNLLPSHEYFLSMYGGMILGLTGTKPKNVHSLKYRMIDQYCPIVYNYTTDEAIEDEILNDYEIIVHTLSLDTNKIIKVEKAGKIWYTSELNIYNYWTGRIDNAITGKELTIVRIMRMKAMMEFPSKEVLARKLSLRISNKCIIFANTMDQADRLCFASYHSNNPLSNINLDNFKKGLITRLSCVLQLSEGVNIPELKESIIIHAYGNERKTAQRIGRTLRLNPDDKATINILCYKDTVDVGWITNALSGFDQTKIKYL